jgi:hypothetical protein
MTVRRASLILVGLLVGGLPGSGRTDDAQAPALQALKMFEEDVTTKPTPHVLTEPERRKLSTAFAALPPLHKRILKERLRSVSFLDGMPNTALTSPANPNEPYRLFDITVRAAILNEDVSQWLTQKERTCFDAGDSPLNVSVELGHLDAILYVLLHEGTHVVDSSLHLTPGEPSHKSGAAAIAFTEGVWSDRVTPVERYRNPLLQGVKYRAGGRPLAIDKAESLYTALGRTPFASLYGSSNWHDDLAEYVALYHLTEVLKQPYRVVIRKAGKEVFAYEPMKSEIVRVRIGQMKPFYGERGSSSST